MSIIDVRNLSKTYTYYNKEVGIKNSIKNLFYRKSLYKEAVKAISFEIDKGEIVGFLGPNGAGKTTTMKLLSGILYPTEGNVKVLGYTPWDRKKEFKKRFALVMAQKNQLWWDLPANESILLNKYIYELDQKEYRNSLDELTEMLDVKDLLPIQVRRLSLGERMKVELIASLIHRPKVIFLDEPTIGLDIIAQKHIREFFKYYNEQYKTTIILTSHYMKDIENLCKRTIIINNGRIGYDGSLAALNDIFNHKRIIKINVPEDASLEQLKEYGTIKQNDGITVTMEVLKDDLKACARYIINNYAVTDFTVENIPLEESVAYIFEKGDDDNSKGSK